MYTYHAEEYDPTEYVRSLPLLKAGKSEDEDGPEEESGKKKKKTKKGPLFRYKDIVCAFDIETSVIKTGEHYRDTKHEEKIDDVVAIMYIWQFQLGPEITIYGRTWDEFRRFMHRIADALLDEERLVIFVHNLAYEWQFIRDQGVLGPWINEDSVFLVKPRTPLSFWCFDDRIEFRCSYLLTNMSLDQFTDTMKVEHQKLEGYDYLRVRYSWTELTESELAYCLNDVRGLVEAIYKTMELDHDTIASIPKTSTGYVRRDIKAATAAIRYTVIRGQMPSYETYKLLREAFRGGNTHANRYYTERRVDDTVNCYDISSSYPNVLINCKFPVKPFKPILKSAMNIDHIKDLIFDKKKAIIMRVALHNVVLDDEFFPVPYLSRDKCRNILNADYDNGRILSAQYLETTITDIDFRILAFEYTFDIEILYAEFSDYGYLPDSIRDVIRDYYQRKTSLKGKGDTDQERAQNEMLYGKAKAKLNACYGMMAQCPVKLDERYIDGHYDVGVWCRAHDKTKYFLSMEECEAHQIDVYELAHEQHIKQSTMPYQWGVWCTCWARLRLEEAIKNCGYDFLYCDTDSVYYIGEKDWSDYNKKRERASRLNKGYADDVHGVRHYMGVLEHDKSMKAFKTMGAKKYAYIDNEYKLHITIAGVSKRKGAEELTQWAKDHNMKDGLDAMREGFVFRDAGGTESVYNDDPLPELEVDGHLIYAPSNVAIRPSTYKTSLSGDYKTTLAFLLDHNLFGLYQLNYQHAWLPSISL